jgi:hypothetical protein
MWPWLHGEIGGHVQRYGTVQGVKQRV